MSTRSTACRRHLHRAEDDLEEPRHRRHGHRDLRLHAPALGARRRPLFAGDRPPIESQTVSQMVDKTLDLPEGSRLYLLAPPCAAARASTARSWRTGRRRASSASRSTAPSTRSPMRPALDKKLKHDIDVVVDRVVVRPDMATRLADSFETALKLADGIAVIEFADARPRAASRSVSSSRRSSPARSRASPFRRSSRASSPSTIPSAPARPATASASSRRSTRTSSSPTRICRCARAPSRPGRARPRPSTPRRSTPCRSTMASRSPRPGTSCRMSRRRRSSSARARRP